MDILTLHRKGFKQRAIARKLGISRNTVKKYIEDPRLVLSPAKPRQRKSLLDTFHDSTRYFTDSGIIGTKAFVAQKYQLFKHLFQSKHEKIPKPIKGLDGVYSLKWLSEGI